MNKKVAIIFGSLILIAIFVLAPILIKTKKITKELNHSPTETSQDEIPKSQQTQKELKQKELKQEEPKKDIQKNMVKIKDLKQFRGLKENEKESLISFSHIMYESITHEQNHQNLIAKLKEKNLQPRVMSDNNPHTGNMTVVRTDNTIPGTRYFHAQYFDDGNGQHQVLQHLSFEIRPSVDSFEATAYTLKKTFGITTAPKYQRDDYVLWDTGDGRVLWIKKLGQKDLKEDLQGAPFNAYDPNQDVGTIRVAAELEIHDHAPHAHIERVLEEGDRGDEAD